MVRGEPKAIKLKGEIVQKRLQKYYILSGTLPAKVAESAPGKQFES